ncbi:mucin-2-like [Paramacrobiotus metropolitanus]|uniref:mucin-2-like n=1 Tax=Paramacrobiotus metropolitanus TaxID=2943436 RepID=UPI0024463D37|nr:mucin-2-like [Paramacrobiotus metropolitanus]XP_055343801.1 mucin-2-like [Paramacrobiotus metropolitanus]
MDFLNPLGLIFFVLIGYAASQTAVNETSPVPALNATVPVDSNNASTANSSAVLSNNSSVPDTNTPAASATVESSSNGTNANSSLPTTTPDAGSDANVTAAPVAPQATDASIAETETLSSAEAPVTSASGPGAGPTVSIVPAGSDAIEPDTVTPVAVTEPLPTMPPAPVAPPVAALRPVSNPNPPAPASPVGRNLADIAATNANRPSAGFLFGVAFNPNPQWSAVGMRNLQVPEVWQALDSLGRKSALDAQALSELLISAVAGKDYPIRADIPDIQSFSCEKVNQAGFYADADFQCQVIRRCDLNNIMWSYICPNMTVFNQITLTCDWFFNVDCSKAQNFYDYSNSRLYHDEWVLLDDSQVTQQLGAVAEPPRAVVAPAAVRPPVVPAPQPSRPSVVAVQPSRGYSIPPATTSRPVPPPTQPPRSSALGGAQQPVPSLPRPVGTPVAPQSAPFRGNQIPPTASVTSNQIAGVSPYRQTFTPTSNQFLSGGQRTGSQTKTQTIGGQRQSMTMNRMSPMSLTPGVLPTPAANTFGRSVSQQSNTVARSGSPSPFPGFNRFAQGNQG